MAKNNNSNGFTLVEMMIIVAIIGILAAVAIGGQQEYIRRSREAEATSILSNIRIRQEAYRGTFHRYADCRNDSWHPPNSTIGDQSQDWGNHDATPNWRQMGAIPTGALFYTYYSSAGIPGGGGGGDADADADADADTTTCASAIDANDFWYCARAESDLDNDGFCAGMTIRSGSTTIMRHEEAICVWE